MSGEKLQDIARQVAEGLPGTDEGHPFVDKLGVWKVSGKVFLMVTDDPQERIITVKCEPDRAHHLRRHHEAISPGRYLDKHHWISVGAGGGITEELVEELVTHSYDLVLEGVPRGRRPEGAESEGRRR
ncbi:MmcQ/YjbR family DNA-binding protein [Streptomyces sp. NPDC017890]|uniref:MmcQ/YjbR family DNA-binding protein n=1 Tax=Streptomyces sp. NPDC017890 TaxID=3365015 RepID=UPI00379D6486